MRLLERVRRARRRVEQHEPQRCARLDTRPLVDGVADPHPAPPGRVARAQVERLVEAGARPHRREAGRCRVDANAPKSGQLPLSHAADPSGADTKLGMPDDRVLLITGASTGIGAATARHAARAGWRLVLSARSEDKLTALADELGGAERAIAVPADVSKWEDQEALVTA